MLIYYRPRRLSLGERANAFRYRFDRVMTKRGDEKAALADEDLAAAGFPAHQMMDNLAAGDSGSPPATALPEEA